MEWLDAVQNGVQGRRLELGDMEDGVNRVHSIRKAKCKGVGSHLSDDEEGSKVLLRKFLGQTY